MHVWECITNRNNVRRNSNSSKIKDMERESLYNNETPNKLNTPLNKVNNDMLEEINRMKDEMNQMKDKIDEMVSESGRKENIFNKSQTIELKSIHKGSFSEIQTNHI